MISKNVKTLMIGALLVSLLCACDGTLNSEKQQKSYFTDEDKDYADAQSPGKQEASHAYRYFFLPEKDGIQQPYVGDPMPYYEDGIFYIYYLKDGGDSYNHSVYLAESDDFITYKEYPEPVLEASRKGGQDAWIGTGSIVKVEDKYYFFYTGQASSESHEYAQKIMLAESDNLHSWKKREGWEITPPAELGQKKDFRDPQAYYDPAGEKIIMTITAQQDGTARILKYSLNKDLTEQNYEGIIFTDPAKEFWNLECSDTFSIGDVHYLTYSGQDDTLWYARSEEAYGPYSEPKRLDGKLFYAAKHVSDGTDHYMAGWARRSESPSSLREVSAWGGNLIVQKIEQKENGDLILVPLEQLISQFDQERPLRTEDNTVEMNAGAKYLYTEAFTSYESFLLKGDFTYSDEGSFGLSFDFDGDQSKSKSIVYSPKDQQIKLLFNEGDTLITSCDAALKPGIKYSFTYIQEGSVGIFYLDDIASLTVRLYGVSGKAINLFAENNKVLFSNLQEFTA